MIQNIMHFLPLDHSQAFSQGFPETTSLNPYQFHEPDQGTQDLIEYVIKNGNILALDGLLANQKIKLDGYFAMKIAIQGNHAKSLAHLIQDGRVDPSAQENFAIREASGLGHIEIVKILLQDPRVDSSAKDNGAFRTAALLAHVEIAKMLMEDSRVDPSVCYNDASRLAKKGCQWRLIFNMALHDPRVDPRDVFALQWAVRTGDIGILKSILQGRNEDLSSVNHYELFRKAVRKGHLEIGKMLLEDTRTDPSIEIQDWIQWAVKDAFREILNILLRGGRPHLMPAKLLGTHQAHAVRLQTQIVKMLLQDARVDLNDELIRQAVRSAKPQIVQELLQDPRVDPSVDNNLLILQAVSTGTHENVQVLLQDPRVDPSVNDNEAIQTAAEYGRTDNLKMLLKHPKVDPSANNNKVIQLAARYGLNEIVKMLLQDPRVDPSANNNEAFREAVRHESIEIARMLFEDPRMDPSMDNNSLIRWAVGDAFHEIYDELTLDRDDIDTMSFDDVMMSEDQAYECQQQIVEMLLEHPKVDPSANDNEAIQAAAGLRWYIFVEMLLEDPRVDPSANNNQAIQSAVNQDHECIVEMLLEDPRVDPSVNDNQLIRRAARQGNVQIVNTFLQDPRVVKKGNLSEIVALLDESLDALHFYRTFREDQFD